MMELKHQTAADNMTGNPHKLLFPLLLKFFWIFRPKHLNQETDMITDKNQIGGGIMF